MLSYFTFGPVVGYVVEMGLKSVHQTIFGLTHILHAAAFAGEAIYDVGAFARNILFCYILPACGRAGDTSRFVKFWTISEFLVLQGLLGLEAGSLVSVGGRRACTRISLRFLGRLKAVRIPLSKRPLVEHDLPRMSQLF